MKIPEFTAECGFKGYRSYFASNKQDASVETGRVLPQRTIASSACRYACAVAQGLCTGGCIGAFPEAVPHCITGCHEVGNYCRSGC
jgi:hypothetical protein